MYSLVCHVKNVFDMDPQPPGEVTQLLIDLREGNQAALNRLFPLVYVEVQRMASSYLHLEYQNQTLRTSDLVHEAYMKLAGDDVSWQNRSHLRKGSDNGRTCEKGGSTFHQRV